MSSNDVVNKDQQATPQKIASIATEQATIDRTALIGVFGNEKAPNALMREANGKIARVSTGDRVAGGTVQAIGTDRLVLNRNGRAKVYRLPKS